MPAPSRLKRSLPSPGLPGRIPSCYPSLRSHPRLPGQLFPASSRHLSSGRPVSGREGTTSPAAVTLRVFNPSPTLALVNLKLEWALEVNGSLRQKGVTGSLSIAPQHVSFVHIPARLPGGGSNEIFLRLRCLRIPLPSSGAVRPSVAGERPKVLPALRSYSWKSSCSWRRWPATRRKSSRMAI